MTSATMPTPRIRHQEQASTIGATQVAFFDSAGTIESDVNMLYGLLSSSERRALLAHELAHIYSGDCKRRSRLRVACHVLLLGDGFVPLLENSPKLEQQADMLAVSIFDCQPEALASGLEKLGGLVFSHTAGSQILAATTTSEAPRLRGRLVNLWMPCLAFYTVYVRGLGLGYWHPELRKRCEALRSM